VFFGVIVEAVPFCCASAAGTGSSKVAAIKVSTRLPAAISRTPHHAPPLAGGALVCRNNAAGVALFQRR
jgi:hypothetical protein